MKRAVERLRELRTVLPALARIAVRQTAAETAEATFTQLTEQLNGAKDRHAGLQTAAEQERQKVARYAERVTELNRDIGIITEECNRLGEQIRQAEQTAELHRRLETERAKCFDPNLDDRFAQAEQAVAEAQAARDAFPHLEVILRNRTAYRQAIADASTATAAEAAASDAVAGLQATEREAVDFADAEATRAEAARQTAALAASQLGQARDQLSRFGTIVGDAICSRCRQPIGPEYIEGERRELEQRVRVAEVECERCEAESQTATAAAGAARRVAQGREAERREAETTRDGAVRGRRDAEKTASEARTAFENARAELSPELVEQVDGIDTEGFPTRTDVSRAREIGRQIPERTRTRDELRVMRQERDTTVAAIATLEQAVTAVGACRT